MSTLALPPMRALDGRWTPSAGVGSAVGNTLDIVTLNTWFSHHARDHRLRAQLTALAQLTPDIVCLQEVTDDLLARLLASPWVRETYAMVSEPHLPLASHGYGVVLLVRADLAHTYRWTPLDSEMGRSLLCVDLGPQLAVGTVHLESMKGYGAARARQLDHCTLLLSHADTALLLGDFNFDPRDTDAPDLDVWTDLWTVAHPHDPGYTADQAINTMRRRPGVPPRRLRIDRAVLRDDTMRWKVGHMALFGNEPIGPNLWMSDHFGLHLTMHRAPPG